MNCFKRSETSVTGSDSFDSKEHLAIVFGGQIRSTSLDRVHLERLRWIEWLGGHIQGIGLGEKLKYA